MKINYYPEKDFLYIHLSDQSSIESVEISEGVVLDYDDSGSLMGIDIDIAVFSRMRGNKILERLTIQDCNTPHSCDYRYNASNKVQLKELICHQLPIAA